MKGLRAGHWWCYTCPLLLSLWGVRDGASAPATLWRLTPPARRGEGGDTWLVPSSFHSPFLCGGVGKARRKRGPWHTPRVPRAPRLPTHHRGKWNEGEVSSDASSARQSFPSPLLSAGARPQAGACGGSPHASPSEERREGMEDVEDVTDV